jgi:hypothetical protein
MCDNVNERAVQRYKGQPVGLSLFRDFACSLQVGGLRLRRFDKEDGKWSVRTASTSGKEPVKP